LGSIWIEEVMPSGTPVVRVLGGEFLEPVDGHTVVVHDPSILSGLLPSPVEPEGEPGQLMLGVV
jgi:hypothetical protein